MVKAIARNPIVSAIVKIATCGIGGPVGIAACVGVSMGLAIGAGGSLADALIAGALAFIQSPFNEIGGLWGGVHEALKSVQEGLMWVVKPVVHGAIAGALNVIQGGEFLHGFASGAAGAIGGMVGVGIFGQPGRAGDVNGFIGRTAIASVAGGAASKLSGGKFANGAVTAAFAHMYNAEGGGRKIGIGHNRPPKPSWFAQIARGIGAAFRRIPGVGTFITGMGITAADNNAGLHFKNYDAAQAHFEQHGADIARALGNRSYDLDSYVADALHVVGHGTFVPELNGYVRFMGASGSANYGFVGIDRAAGNITTFHIKSVGELARKAPSLGFRR